jgi:hypothetical protein
MMKTRYNHKGKFFTEVETKVPMEVVIQTHQQQLRGQVYLRPGQRLLDALNEGPHFLAVTGARVEWGAEQLTTAFLALNKHSILWIAPVEELQEDPQDDS